MGFLDSLGRVAEGAVQASPYISQMLAQRQARQKADIAAQLQQLHQQSQDSTASVLANTQAGVGLANIRRINAQANAAENPQVGVRSITDANGVVSLVPTKVAGDTTAITPISTGITGPKKLEPLKTIVGPDGKRQYVQASEAIDKEAPAPASPQDSGVFVSKPGDPNAPPIYTRKKDAFGMIKPPTGTGEGGTGGMGSGGLGGLARTSSGITEMVQADQMMKPFEEAVRGKQANFDGLDYFQGQMAKMYDAHGKIDQAVHAATFNNLNKTNPDLANYLRAGEAWALADGTISGRTSDFRTRMDAFVSAIGPNASDSHINQVQKFRGTRVDELKKFQPAMQAMADRVVGKGRGNQPSVTPKNPNDPGGDIDFRNPPTAGVKASTITPQERQALKAKGFTDEQITAKYGPP